MIVLPTQDNLLKAVARLRQGDLVGLPTETVYGLAGDALQDLAVAKIFEQKKRPTFNPLIIHGSSAEAFKLHVEWNGKAEALAKAFWPGPLTLILPRLPTSTVSLLASAGLDSLAIRVPSHPVALDFLFESGTLIAAPSANLSGNVSPTLARHVVEDFPDLLILEGGASLVGLESTIVDLTTSLPSLLRPGKISPFEIESVIGPLKENQETKVKAPGMLQSHYAPRLPLWLNVSTPQKDKAYLGFGPLSSEGQYVLNLSSSGDLNEAAANLFRMIRELDCAELMGICVAPIPLEGIGIAINDRLQRAAAPRVL